MAECYHRDIQFSDPVFPNLQGSNAMEMWNMLCTQAKGFELKYSGIKADDHEGIAYWEAKYDFSRTGRRVHNRVEANFQFQEGKIIWHQDIFSFWKWSFMALGITGLLLGWTPIVRNKVQRQASNNLEKFKNQQVTAKANKNMHMD